MFVPRKYKLFLPMIFLLCFQNLNSMRDLNKFTTMVNTDQDNYFYDKTIEKNVHFVISDDFEKCELETEIGVVVNTNQYFNNCVLKKALTLTKQIFEGKYKKLEHHFLLMQLTLQIFEKHYDPYQPPYLLQ